MWIPQFHLFKPLSFTEFAPDSCPLSLYFYVHLSWFFSNECKEGLFQSVWSCSMTKMRSVNSFICYWELFVISFTIFIRKAVALQVYFSAHIVHLSVWFIVLPCAFEFVCLVLFMFNILAECGSLNKVLWWFLLGSSSCVPESLMWCTP